MSTRFPPAEAMLHFENLIYFPMIITILSRDFECLTGVKLKKPYLEMIGKSLKLIQAELQETQKYMHSNKMKLIKGEADEIFTEFIFLHNGYEDRRRYLNARLKNRTEELIELYFAKTIL